MNTNDLDAVRRFCHAQLALIDSEQSLDAESSAAALQHYGKKELERRGQALTQCQVAGARTGFGGKTLVEIERAAGGKGAGVQQNAHSPMGQVMRTGDLIRIEQQLSGSATKKQLGDAAAHGVEGVVTKAQDDRLVVALTREEAEAPAQGLQVWCVKLANTVTYERMRKHVKTLLKQVEEGSSGPLALHRILLQNEAPSVLDAEVLVKEVHFYDAGLNGPQQQAVRHALAARELSIIHGPPGTGKTSTLVEIIRQCTAKGLRLLVCSASNIAVDNLAERLAAASVPLVRVGHPARLLPSITQHALDVLVSQSDSAQLVRDIRKELDGNLQTMSKVKLGRGAPTNGPAAGGKDRKRGLYLENKQLRQELRQRERVCTTQVLADSRVVLATLHGSGGGVLRGQVFDVAVIDEAAQALEAQCWIALSQVSKVILAGDHLQLPPVVKTENMASVLKAYGQRVAEEDGVMRSSMSLSKEAPDSTLFLRLLKRFEKQRRDDVVSFLSIQYRMHAAICKFPSEVLYAGRLQPPDAASSNIGAHLLKDLPGVADTDDTHVPLVFIDTQGFELYEDVQKESGFSRSNEAECELIQAHVNALLDAGVKAEEMAVLTPYSAQVALLSARFFDLEQTGGRDYAGLEVGTVDGMQGREKEAVLLTLVRSQPPGHRSSDESKAPSVGFLNDERRLNVAMTRARRHLCVVGDAETVGARLGNDGDLLRVRWMAYLTEHADLRFPET